jgi:oligoribonuclease NrnB/cAMP/cGMP phosphodiesterase (DHH superfamily)
MFPVAVITLADEGTTARFKRSTQTYKNRRNTMRPDEITEVLKQIAELCNKVTTWAKADNMSYNMIKDDVAFHRTKLESARKELSEIKALAETEKAKGSVYVENAKKEAESIVAMARERLYEASKDRELAAKELKKAQQDRYFVQKERDKVKESVEA